MICDRVSAASAEATTTALAARGRRFTTLIRPRTRDGSSFVELSPRRRSGVRTA
jgi:hypothetical protein